MSFLRKWLDSHRQRRRVRKCRHEYGVLHRYPPIVEAQIHVFKPDGFGGAVRNIGREPLKVKCRRCGHTAMGSRLWMGIAGED